MSRRLQISLGLALALAAFACAAVALAAGGGSGTVGIPAGPRLTFLEVRSATKAGKKLRPEWFENAYRLVSVDPKGGDLRRFATPRLAPLVIGTVSWSADGEKVAFAAEPTADLDKAGDQTGSRIYVADADGSHLHAIPGTRHSTRPVLSPDGESVAVTRSRTSHQIIDPLNPKTYENAFRGSTTWLVRVASGKARRLTPWQNFSYADPSSFSPDGSLLAVTVNPAHGPQEVDTIDLATGKTKTVVVEGGEAAFSPDGSRIAFTSYRDRGSVPGFDEPEGTKEIYLADADGTRARRLTKTPEQDETAPSWDPSGSRLGYLRTPGGMLQFLGIKGEVMESNADGTCPIVIARPAKLGKGLRYVGAGTGLGAGRRPRRRPAQLLSAARTWAVTRRWAATLVARSARTSIRPVPAARASGRSARDSRRR